MSETPLTAILRQRIAETGPISIAEFMTLTLGHPEHGYYTTRTVFGADGDFVTAPEVSQMFGELLAAWSLDVWQRTGITGPLRLVELGPGRGTLMADMVRTLAKIGIPAEALDLYLVETSERLRIRQREQLATLGVVPRWHDDIGKLPDAPTLVIANEFFDALPIRQFRKASDGWHEILIANIDGNFDFVLAPIPADRALLRDAPSDAAHGTIYEISDAGRTIVARLASRIMAHGGAALIIDYGHVIGFGDTLQAVKAHAAVPVLASPGEADVTAHVDFAALAREAKGADCAVHGPVDQGAFLTALGLKQRATALVHANPDRADAIAADAARLTGADAMGTLFKVMAITTPAAPKPAGFQKTHES